MRKLSLTKRLVAVFLAVILLAAVPSNVLADTISEIKAEQERLEEEKAELESRLEEIKGDAAQKEEYQDLLMEKINTLQEEIDLARENINKLNESITQLNAKIEKAEEDISHTMELFKDRLRALYTSGNITTLEILLDSGSLTEFAMCAQAIESISKRDEELMERIQQYMDETKDERAQCEAEKQQVAVLQKSLEKNQDELTVLYEENAALLAELKNAESEVLDAIAKNEEQGQAAIQKMEEAIAAQKKAEEEANRNNNPNIYYPTGNGGVEGFNPIWPLPGVTYITCYYGSGGHKGLDIAGPYGTPIVAAESGQVIVANDYDSWGDSWGYYVLIYHNGTYTTRYAHMSSLAVSNGQYVSQGEVIGYEGSTGYSTGPHLHFEVYQNGVRVNPLNFL